MPTKEQLIPITKEKFELLQKFLQENSIVFNPVIEVLEKNHFIFDYIKDAEIIKEDKVEVEAKSAETTEVA